MADNSIEALVLSDADGNYYVIPRDVIEQTRVAPEAIESIDAELGVETSGFAAQSIGLGFHLVGPLHASGLGGGAGLPQVGWPYYKPGLNMDKGDPAFGQQGSH
jgi:hypothetical protein